MRLQELAQDRLPLIKTVTLKMNAKGGGTIRVWYDLDGHHADTGVTQLHALPDGLDVRETVRELARAVVKRKIS